MKVTIEIEVTDCRDCIFRRSIRGHGECFEYCSHKDSRTNKYLDALWGCREPFRSVPSWCPLGIKQL